VHAPADRFRRPLDNCEASVGQSGPAQALCRLSCGRLGARIGVRAPVLPARVLHLELHIP
jgi:hypothetical protein